MAKAPAIQFYVRDWLSDPELQSASLISRGAWIQCLCFMWENSKRGELTRTPLKFARLIGGSLDEALHFLNEIYEYEFGDVIVDENVTFPLRETDCNVFVTVRNRRMWADYKDRQNTRLRVRKHRENKTVTEKKQKRNINVTPSSSSSSSTSTTKNKDIGVEYPSWLNLDSWKEYKQHRKEIKSPLSELAEKKALKKLKSLIDNGFDQTDVVDQSIENGWKGLFEIKNSYKKKKRYEDIEPTTYAQAQDLERRGRAKWLKEIENDNQNTGDQGTDKAIPLLPGDQV